MKRSLLLSAAFGAAAVTMVASTALAAPVVTESESVAVQALDRHGLLAETVPGGPAQIDGGGSATIGGVTVQPEAASQGAERPQPGLA